jgi:hypothetical protein
MTIAITKLPDDTFGTPPCDCHLPGKPSVARLTVSGRTHHHLFLCDDGFRELSRKLRVLWGPDTYG